MAQLQRRFLVCAFALPWCLQPQTRNTNSMDDASRLPIKRVVLYKNGVGYFEHLGRVRDNQDVAIAFTSGQLNDVLKSVTVLDLNGGRITNIAYGSAAPVDRQLGDLRLPASEKTSITDFLGALRGARLEVRSGTNSITGRLLSVERKTRIAGGTTLEVDYLSLITETGELRTTELSPSFSVRMLDRGLTAKVDRFLDIVAAARESDVRRMVLSTAGSGERSIFVSYISEVPVWKSTYRLVFNPKAGQKPLLQGWAIVDNTVGQDWENVDLSLVAGAPQSFVQNLSQPYYARRPVVDLPESANMAPQTYEATLIAGAGRIAGRISDPSGATIPNATVKAFDAAGTIVGEATTNLDGVYDLQGLPEGSFRLQIESPGFRRSVISDVVASAAKTTLRDVRLDVGNTSETVEVTAAVPGIQTESSDVSSRASGTGRRLGTGESYAKKKAPPPPPPMSAPSRKFDVGALRAQAQAAAQAQALGDLFEYKLKQPVTIQKNRSALVPIVQSPIDAEKVSIWNEHAGFPRPQRALWLTNSSGLTLDGGSFSVLEEETFAGEGIVEPIRPDEKRLVSYATDLALNASSKNSNERERVSRVRIAQGVLSQSSEIREKKTYTFRNEDSTPRTVIVEHPVRSGYELRGDAQPAEVTSGWMRFRVQVKPKETASLVVEEAKPLETTYVLTNITSDQVVLFAREQSINKTIEEALRKILAQKKVIEDLEAQKSARESEAERIFDDQQRLRENMKALKGSQEEKTLVQRYTQQLNSQENRLEALQKESEQLDAKVESAQSELDRMIQELSFNVKL
jgi:hypothetical protein